MKNVISIFESIKNTSSLNDKKSIITENKDNELFKKCLLFLLDGNIQTGLSEKKISKNVAATNALVISTDCETMMEYLKENNSGRDSDISLVQSFINNQPIEYKEFYTEFFTKKYKIGCDAKVVNKCIPGLIPTFDVMLGTPIEKIKLKGDEDIFISRKLNGCFEGNTYVIMGDGSKKKIKNIKVDDMVMSFDEKTNELSKQRVVNVFNNGLKPKEEWVQLEIGVNRKSHKNRIQVTKNHKIYTPNGWVEAGNLNIGDTVYMRDYELSETQKSVLLGIGLGDGNVMFDNPNVDTVRFSYIKKIEKYGEYLHNICNLFDIYAGTYSKYTSGYGTEMEKCTIKTIYNIPSYFTNKNNVLRCGYTFTDEILRNITPLALAIYYIDDGSKLPCKDDGNIYATNKHPRVTLATHRHNKEEVERFSKFLYERYLITNRVARYQPCYEDSGYQIEINLDGTHRFFDLIAKYIPYELREQKLSKHWHNVPYEDWTKDFGEYKLIEKKIENIIPSNEIRLGLQMKNSTIAYDLEVDNTHTYFTNGFAVHNCRAAFVGDKLMTRQGKQYQGVDHIIKDLQILVGKDMFVDGELLYKNKEGLSDSEAFQKGTGIAMSKDSNKSELKLVVFDMFPLCEFLNGESKYRYSERRKNLKGLETDIELLGTENIEIVQMVYSGGDHSEIWRWLDCAEKKDWEGLMINLDTPYECKRTKNLIKVKKFYDITLRVVDIEEGTGRNKNKLGALVCKYKGNTVKCGSGFSDEQREEIWSNKDKYINQLVDVKYKEITKDKNTGLESLQFPVFMGYRYDKESADDE